MDSLVSAVFSARLLLLCFLSSPLKLKLRRLRRQIWQRCPGAKLLRSQMRRRRRARDLTHGVGGGEAGTVIASCVCKPSNAFVFHSPASPNNWLPRWDSVSAHSSRSAVPVTLIRIKTTKRRRSLVWRVNRSWPDVNEWRRPRVGVASKCWAGNVKGEAHGTHLRATWSWGQLRGRAQKKPQLPIITGWKLKAEGFLSACVGPTAPLIATLVLVHIVLCAGCRWWSVHKAHTSAVLLKNETASTVWN